MKRWKIFRLVVAVVLLLCFVPSAGAFAEGVKDRMKSRLPEIIILKSKGLIGENNKGYLDIIGMAGVQKEVIDAENNDRKQVYEAIARQQGTTPEVVGSLRAKQIAERAKPGEWLQDEKGNWYRK